MGCEKSQKWTGFGDCYIKERLKFSNLTLVQIVSALLVIFSHSYRLGDGAVEPLRSFTLGHLTLGELAVAVFLFLSGFMVSESFPSCGGEGSGNRFAGLFEFSVKRLTRIFPTVFTVVFISVFLLGPCCTTLSVAEYFRHPQTWMYMSGSSLFVFYPQLPGVFEQNVYRCAVNGSLWVIPWQMWCYVMVAVFGMFGVHRNRAAVTCMCAITFALYLARNLVFGDLAFLGLVPRLGIRLFLFFAAGWTFSVWKGSIRWDWRAVLVLSLSLPLWIRTSACDLGLATVGAYCLLWLIFAHPLSLSDRLPHISFGVFVFGFPIQQVVTMCFGGKMGHCTNFLLATAISAVLAYAELRLVERLGKRLREKMLRNLESPDCVPEKT